jgi:hypothetical protein
LRRDKNNNFKFSIKFLMTLDRSYIGYLGFLGIDLFKSVLKYSNGPICLIKLLFNMGLFTVKLGKLNFFILYNTAKFSEYRSIVSIYSYILNWFPISFIH